MIMRLLIYIIIETWPNITYIVLECYQFAFNLEISYFKGVKYIFEYINNI